VKRSAALALFPVVIAAVACSTSSSPSPVSCASPGGPAAGAQDVHCTGDGGAIIQPTSEASCHPDAGGSGGVDAGLGSTYGATMYGTEADDDDCKYHLKWSASTVCENADVYFTLTATRRTDDTPLTGASPDLEVFLNATTPAAPPTQAPVEGPPGTYKAGPIRFSAAGRWTVRFHLDENCADLLPDSPHGHAGFYVDVP
jgi:hypothetical protein